MSPDMTRDHRAALMFQDIDISRMDGIRNGYRVDALSPGINLIHGPNGIGKSRTAAALQALIWPGSCSGRSEMFGNVQVSGELWRVDLDFAKVSYQRDGVPESSPGFATLSDSHRDRYLLTLQDLLRVENRNFAHEIRKEAAGGYDLGRVRDEMRVRTDSRAFRPSRPVKPLQEARNEISILRRQETELRQQERSLSELVTEREAAIRASTRMNELQAAREYHDACDQRDEATLRRAAFPDPVGQMLGDEYERMQGLQQDLDEATHKRQERDLEIAMLREELRETGFSDAMPPDTLIPTLRKRLEDVRTLEMTVRQVDMEICQYHASIETLNERFGDHPRDAELEKLDEVGLRELAKLTRDWQRAGATLEAQEALRDWLGPASPQDREPLRKGADLLARYLRLAESETQTVPSRQVFLALIGATVLIALESILLAIAMSPALLFFAVLALPLVWIAATMRSSAAAGDVTRVREEYATLNLEAPESWTPDAVSRVLATLQAATATAELEHQRAMRWGDLEARRQQAADELKGLSQQREAFIRTYGVELGQNGPESLQLMATAVEQWRRASDDLVKALSRKASTEERIATTLTALNDDLRNHGAERDVSDASSAESAIEHLAERIETATRLTSEHNHTKRSLDEELTPRIDELGKLIDAIYTNLLLEPGDAFALKNLCDQIGSCREAQLNLDSAFILVAIARARLRPDSGYEGMSRDEIERALEEASELAARRDGLQERISDIHAEIGQAQQQTRLEAAIARETVALDDLKEGRQRDYDAAAARRVFDLVQSQNREVNRPPVFRVADELFVSFTNGVYRLGLDDEESEFTALETASGRVLSLDHLSSGTRVQLLLAVRLAFIEATEQGPQLPVILDETLGNTDDTRATAIINATIEIVRRGRQVIYFTAQQDEIGKWSAALDTLDEPVSWDVFDLARIRGKAQAGSKCQHVWNRSVIETIDVPADADHSALFEILDVPRVDLWADHVRGVDLWYLVPDVSALVELRRRKVHTWGQYLALHRDQNLKGVWSERLHACAEVRALVIEAVCRDWRQGRPRPLTKESLRACDLITDRFWDDVNQCAETQGWDGAALITALRRREVSNFYTSTIDKLEDWFQEHGHITGVNPLSDEMIRARVISVVNTSVDQGIIAEEEIDELLTHIAGEPVLTR